MDKKTAIVTGGASGIGLATCLLLAKENYDVVFSDINHHKGEEALAQLKELSVGHAFIKADVSDSDEINNLIGFTVSKYGKIDLLVNNAGIGPAKLYKTADHPVDEWNKIIALNQSGVFYAMKFALSVMEKQGFGNIVNVSSLAGVSGSLTGLAYSASKFAVVGMTKSAALEYGKLGIRINCVCPAFTETPLFNNTDLSQDPKKREFLLRSTPLKRFASPNEIAESIFWLASEKSSYMTGHALVVDGGLSA